MLSSLDLHLRQKQYYCLYLFSTVTEKSSSDKQPLSCLLIVNRKAAPPAPSPWAAEEAAGGWEGRAPLHKHPVLLFFPSISHSLLANMEQQVWWTFVLTHCGWCNVTIAMRRVLEHAVSLCTWHLWLILKASKYHISHPSSPPKKRLFPNPTVYSCMLKRKSHCHYYLQQQWSCIKINTLHINYTLRTYKVERSFILLGIFLVK